MVIRAIKGTRDVFGVEIRKWNIVENRILEFMRKYNYEEIRTPTFEQTQLYLRGIGDETDIVNKEMYTFIDKGGRSITLRPEGTAGVVRAYIENKMYADKTVKKLFYMGSMFRQERPQKGRYREFRQFGIENIGTEEALADAEVIAFAYNLYKALGLKSVKIEINSIGCQECRKKYLKALKNFLKPHYNELCENCQRRFETNTLRVLDCKNPKCKKVTEGAPSTIDYLCDGCKRHFKAVLHYLDIQDIPYVVNNRLVRGLDYYTRTVFEVTTDMLGSQNAIAAGGRYDYLIGM
ncbi:histidine--tRNA ligase, partial [candidate division TA06 bacterium]